MAYKKSEFRNKAQEMKQMIENENLDVVQVVPVLAQDYEMDDKYTEKAYGSPISTRTR